MILPLEELVPSRETCQRLASAGFPMQTRYFWRSEREGVWYLSQPQPSKLSDKAGVFLPAPTAAELGALLSKAASGTPGRMVDSFSFGDGSYWAACLKDCNGGERNICCKNADTEAEARALLWLDLHERNLLPESTYHHEAPESQ